IEAILLHFRNKNAVEYQTVTDRNDHIRCFQTIGQRTRHCSSVNLQFVEQHKKRRYQNGYERNMYRYNRFCKHPDNHKYEYKKIFLLSDYFEQIVEQYINNAGHRNQDRKSTRLTSSHAS